MVGSDIPEDFFVEHILVGMAEFYSRNRSREIMKGLKQRAQQGHLVFRPPYGYRREIIERQEGHNRTRIISRPRAWAIVVGRRCTADYRSSSRASVLIENESRLGTKLTVGTQDCPHSNVADERL